MALDPKTQKFVDFYLSELLGHVRSMGEQRFAPVEFAVVKKIVAFVAQSGNRGTEALASVSTSPRPVHAFLQKIVGKIQQPDFKMSQMLSVIESDSDKILQLFARVLGDGAGHAQLERELRGLGVVLDLDTLKKTHARPAVVPATSVQAAAETRDSKSETAAFGKVDDMIGFLSRRNKKTTEEKPAVLEKDEGKTSEDYAEGKNSDRNDFLTELETGIHALGNALKQLKTNPSKTRYVIETADAFGLIKKTARIFDLPRLRDCMMEIEQLLNNVADNLDDRKVTLSSNAVTALETMAKTLGQIYSGKILPLQAGILQALADALNTFQTGLGAKTPAEPAAPDETGDTTILLNTTHIAEEDWRVFRSEVQYNFDVMASAVSRLRNSSADAEAAKDMYQAARALHTSSKLLRLSFLAAHYEILFSIYKEKLHQHEPIAPELLEWSEASLQACSALVNREAISDSEWLRINTGLMKFTDYEEAPVVSKTAAPLASAKIMPPVKEEAGEATIASVLHANEHWMEEFQNILIAHDQLSIRIGTQEDKTETVSPEPVKEEVKETPVKKVQVTEKPAEIKSKSLEPAVASSTEKMHVEIPDELINAMARGELDISDRTILNFAERLSVEPQDIISGDKKVKVKTAASKRTTVDEKVSPPPPVKKEISKTVRGSLILQETHAASVDPEILDIFNQESADYFKTIDRALEKLQANIKDDGAVKELERVSHSLKSSSRMLGFERVSGLAAAMELIAERCNENELKFTKDTLELVTALTGAIQALVGGQKADVTKVIQKLFNLESEMLAPNIFTAHIPGAAEIGMSVKEGAADTAVTETVTEEPAAEPEPKPEETKIEQPPAVAENYFKKLGVDEEIVEIFKEESATYFKLMAAALQTLRSDLANEHALHDIEKSAHSLRSSAKMLGFQKIGNLARPVEAISERINDGAVDLDTTILNLFDGAVQLLQTLARGTDVDIENILTQLSRIEKLPSKTSKTDKRDSAQAIQSIKDQLADTSGEKAASKSAMSKAVHTPADDFDDIELMKDPILKQLSHEEGNVLEDMSVSTQKEVH